MVCKKCGSVSTFSARYKCLICGTINKPHYTRFGNPLVSIRRKDGKDVVVHAATIRVR